MQGWRTGRPNTIASYAGSTSHIHYVEGGAEFHTGNECMLSLASKMQLFIHK